MNLLRLILEQDTKPGADRPNKIKVLFIGDANSQTSRSYAAKILNTDEFEGVVKTKADATAIDIKELVQKNIDESYAVVTIQYSNIRPTTYLKDTDELKSAFNAAKQYDAKLIVIANPSKEFVAYKKAEFPDDDKIHEWIMSSNIPNAIIDTREFASSAANFEKNGLTLDPETQDAISNEWIAEFESFDIDLISTTKSNRTAAKRKKDKTRSDKFDDEQRVTRQIQRRLKTLGYPIDSAEIKSGKPGKSTTDAIKSFQRLNGLKVTGELTPAVAIAINSQNAKTYSKWKDAIKSITEPETDPETASTASNSSQSGTQTSSQPVDAAPRNVRLNPSYLSYNELVDLALNAGFTDDESKIMAAIALAESRGDANALNDTTATGDLSYGLWQINMIDKPGYMLGEERRKKFGLKSNEELWDPKVNARVARGIYLSQSYNAWSVYNTGAYKKYLQSEPV